MNTLYPQPNRPALPPEQLSKLIELLGKQPQANPTSPQYDRAYVDLLSSLNNSVSQTQQSVTPSPLPLQTPESSPTSQPKYRVVRVADNIEKINAAEVQMGTKNIFPSSDEKKIFVKFWGNDGSIIPKVYILQEDAVNIGSLDDSRIDDIQMRVEKLEETVLKLKKQNSTKTRTVSKKPKASAPLKTEETEASENE